MAIKITRRQKHPMISLLSPAEWEHHRPTDTQPGNHDIVDALRRLHMSWKSETGWPAGITKTQLLPRFQLIAGSSLLMGYFLSTL